MMMDGDGNEARVRQDDEVLALQSIYGNDVVNLGESKCWKMWRPFDLIIHLYPSYSGDSEDSDRFVSIDLHVTCKEDYPMKSSPEIVLENPKGLSDDDVKVLESMLKQKSHDLLGSEVVLELCQIIQEFLSERNKPPEGSFHDGMLRQKAAEEYEIKRQKDQFEQQEREEIAAFEDMRRDKLLWKEAENYEKVMKKNRVLTSEVFSCIGNGKPRRICFTSPANERRFLSSNPFCRRSAAFDFDTNNELLVTEWKFVYSLGRKGVSRKSLFCTEPFLGKLEKLESEMLRLVKWKPQNQSLCAYSFFCIQKKSISPSNVDVRIVYGQDLKSDEINLEECLDRITTNSKLMTKLASSLVSMLKCLHEEQLLHLNLNAQTVWYATNGTFRTTDYHVMPFIMNLCEAFEEGSSKCTTATVGNVSRKDDILLLKDLFQSFLPKVTDERLKGWLKNFTHQLVNAKSVEDINGDDSLLVYVNSPSSGTVMVGDRGISFENPNGRLKNEFVYVEFLGKGGFGDVIRARNKLDGNDYAIKRIPLDPKDEKLNKKVMREAKLFSRLCHPNVVRYFCAWIENVSTVSSAVQSSSEAVDHMSTSHQSSDDCCYLDFLLPKNLRNLESQAVDAPVEPTAEWTTSFHQEYKFSSSSESSSDDNDVVPYSDMHRSSNIVSNATNSDFEVLFQENDRLGIDESSEKRSEESSDGSAESHREKLGELGVRVLYIQMEYCERSTLRSAIDGDQLFKSPRRIWQMLKEILLGLRYIHQQGMIHRDIKPMNILIDEAGRAKIGDFGLATRNYLERQSISAVANKGSSTLSEGSLLTKDIGTALYIAPELLSSSNTTDYTSKIDVYSVGIVLFEMFYRPLLPGMERISVLKNLRHSSFFPDDFATSVPEVHGKTAKRLIKWMMTLASEERPSVNDILESECIPSIELNETEFQKIFSQAIRSGTGKLREWIIDKMFAEPVPQAVNFLYDQSVCITKNRLGVPVVRATEMIRQSIVNICKLHAFVELPTHSLVPFSYSVSTASSRLHESRFIDDCGTLVCLPFDLRRTFVRYCVRNGISRFKRYSFGKVYGSSYKLGGAHPTERTELALDCLGPRNSSPLLTAEILYIVLSITKQIAMFRAFKWQLRIGHRLLVIAAMTYLGCTDSTIQAKVLDALHNISNSDEMLNRNQRLDRLQTIGGLAQNQANSLLNILENDEHTLSALREKFRPLLKGRNESVRESTRRGIDDLHSCYTILELLCADHSLQTERIKFDSSLCYRPLIFASGIVFQLSVLYPRKQSVRLVTACYGGHYHDLLNNERRGRDPTPPVPLCAVGCDFILDSLANLYCSRFPDFGKSLCSSIVCSKSSELMTEKMELVRLLWDNNISADVLFDPVSSADEPGFIEHCNEMKILNILVVIGRNEVLLRSGDFDYGKLTFDKALAKLQMAVMGDSGTALSMANEGSVDSTVTTTANDVALSNLPKQGSNSFSTATGANLCINYALCEKLAYNLKKRIETQVPIFLQKTLTHFSSATRVEVVVCDLPPDVIRQLVTMVERTFTPEELYIAFETLLLQFNKYKKELNCLRETLDDIYRSKENSVIAVYSKLNSNGFCRFIL